MLGNRGELVPQLAYIRRRVTLATGIVTITALLAGVAIGIRDPRWALLAAAVIYGWSQIGGA